MTDLIGLRPGLAESYRLSFAWSEDRSQEMEMDAGELIKVLYCGDASHAEQQQAADLIDRLRRQNRELVTEIEIRGDVISALQNGGAP